MKTTLTILAAILVGFLVWLLGGEKWSGYRWDGYLHQTGCIAAKVENGKGKEGNRLELRGEGETAPYLTTVSLWSCTDGRMVAIYEGLPEAVPVRLVYQEALRYRHGFLSDDDAHRFVDAQDVARLKSIKDWDAIVARRPK